MADFCFVEVEASNTEVAGWRLLSATGELRHFYKNGVGEAPTFSSEMGESALGIEIENELGECLCVADINAMTLSVVTHFLIKRESQSYSKQ